MTIWQQVSDDEVRNLQQRADRDGGTLALDDALSALRAEMTDELVDETRAFWSSRGVTVRVEVEPEVDPTADIPETALVQRTVAVPAAGRDGETFDDDAATGTARAGARASRRKRSQDTSIRSRMAGFGLCTRAIRTERWTTAARSVASTAARARIAAPVADVSRSATTRTSRSSTSALIWHQAGDWAPPSAR